MDLTRPYLGGVAKWLRDLAESSERQSQADAGMLPHVADDNPCDATGSYQHIET